MNSQKTLGLLITSAGRRVELLKLFRRDADELGLSLRVIAADLDPEWSPACHVADKSYSVPRANTPEYASAIRDIARNERCGLIVPTIDPELLPLARARDEGMFADIGAHAVVQPTRFVETCRDKQRTMEWLAGKGVRVPKTYSRESLASERSSAGAICWPLIVKPVDGSSSDGISIHKDAASLEQVEVTARDIVQHYVEGPEFTVNCYAGLDGQLLFAMAHLRKATRGGEVEKAQAVHLDGVEEIAKAIVLSELAPRGPFCFQLKQDLSGSLYVFEINARFGGGFPLAHQCRGAFTRWLIEEYVLDKRIQPTSPDYGWRMMRHDHSIFAKAGG
jgi:carbamoyl-phosphate synthase large subunit